MRNIIKHPISKEEIIACLRTLAVQISQETPPIIGDMRPLLLSMAANLVQASDYPDEAKLKAEYNPDVLQSGDHGSPAFQVDGGSGLGETDGPDGWGNRPSRDMG